MASITSREEEGSYLVGDLAGLNSSTGVVGFIGGMDVPVIHKFQAGSEAGAKAANAKVKVIAQYVGNTPDAWSNPAKAKEIAASMRGRGADIIFAAAGGSGNGLIEYVKQTQCLKASQLPAGVKFASDNFAKVPKSASYKAACAGDGRPMFFIGVDANQNYLGDVDKNPATLNHGLTSMLKRVDSAVFVLGQRASQGSYSSGELSFGLKERGVGYALDNYNKALISAGQIEQLQTIMSMISTGNLSIPTK